MTVEVAERRRAAIGQVHLAHPKCPACGRALYKAATTGTRVTKRERYAWCRNEACSLRGRDIADVVRIGGILLDLREPTGREVLSRAMESWR